jgi:cell division protein FtsB
MARNRKNNSTAIRFGPALKAFLLCLLIGGSGVGYVWQKNQILELGRQFKKQETKLKELKDQNEKLRGQLATLRNPRVVEQRIKELNLGLVYPKEFQIKRLDEPTSFAAPPETQSAGRSYSARPTLAALP